MSTVADVGRGQRNVVVATLVRALGATLLAVTGWIHLHLYLDGYRTIPTVGRLFLLNAVCAAIATLALLTVRRRWLLAVAVAGGLLEAGTLGGLVLSLTVGLFGFTESFRAPLLAASIAVEGIGSLLLLGFAALTVRAQQTEDV